MQVRSGPNDKNYRCRFTYATGKKKRFFYGFSSISQSILNQFQKLKQILKALHQNEKMTKGFGIRIPYHQFSWFSFLEYILIKIISGEYFLSKIKVLAVWRLLAKLKSSKEGSRKSLSQFGCMGKFLFI